MQNIFRSAVTTLPAQHGHAQGIWDVAGDGKTGILARMPMAMVYECGPWTGCKDGAKCLQAVTQRVGLIFRSCCLASVSL